LINTITIQNESRGHAILRLLTWRRIRLEKKIRAKYTPEYIEEITKRLKELNSVKLSEAGANDSPEDKAP
jgi:hypothetical protein